jgi:hypothetical protein
MIGRRRFSNRRVFMMRILKEKKESSVLLFILYFLHHTLGIYTSERENIDSIHIY